MESDDDYQSFSPLEESSPPAQTRKLKRLKKTITVSEDPIVDSSQEEGFSVPVIDSLNSDALESSDPQGADEDSDEPVRFRSVAEGLGEEKESSNGLESSHFRSESVGFDEENELNLGSESPHLEESSLGVKRVLEFDVVEGEGGDGGGEMGGEALDSDEKRRDSEGVKEKKEKKSKRAKRDGDEENGKVTASDKRRAEKERREYLKHLHAESQRLLRETREAAFKPLPVKQKPISSILEKIRQRKLEVSKLIARRKISTYENDDSSRDTLMDLDSENSPIDERGDDETLRVVNEEAIMQPAGVESSLDASDINEPSQSAEDLSREHIPSQVLDEESKPAFRAPIDDTQDLYCDSQSSDSRDEQPSEQDDSPVEEAFAPSLLAMNLKLDSAPPDEMSSDEEDNDKENINPIAPGLQLNSYPKGDPVKAFVDEEAVEEDDSDNDLSRFKENEEDDDAEDAEELKDMIATEYEEKPIDDEMRHQLHMKWLEQQDAFGTDKLLQKYGCGSKYGETTLLETGDEREEDEEDSSDEATENLLSMNATRMHARKLKQMIPQMFTDKDDVYLSSDDEETEKILVKQRLLKKAEDKATFLSPVEDDSSREVFGLIKKLNIVPDTKKKSKASSSLDIMSTRRSNSSSKSSFLGRASSSSLSSSRKRVSSTMRSYIFERDDSNSRSAISMSEDSSDTIQKEVCSTKTFSAKFSNSQPKSSSQNTKTTAETISGTSLFEILRRSSLQTNHSNRDEVVQTQSVFAAFKLSKKSIKREGQS